MLQRLSYKLYYREKKRKKQRFFPLHKNINSVVPFQFFLFIYLVTRRGTVSVPVKNKFIPLFNRGGCSLGSR